MSWGDGLPTEMRRTEVMGLPTGEKRAGDPGRMGLDRGGNGVYMRLTRSEIPSRLAAGAPNACVNDDDRDAV
jgi:hypothetical protein